MRVVILGDTGRPTLQGRSPSKTASSVKYEATPLHQEFLISH
jgi:hypothetical protein